MSDFSECSKKISDAMSDFSEYPKKISDAMSDFSESSKKILDAMSDFSAGVAKAERQISRAVQRLLPLKTGGLTSGRSDRLTLPSC